MVGLLFSNNGMKAFEDIMVIKDNYWYDPYTLTVSDGKIDEEQFLNIVSKIEQNNSATIDLLMQSDPTCVSQRVNTVNEINICPTYNCNFRCTYCDASSVEGNALLLPIGDIQGFVFDAIKRWKMGKLINQNKDRLKINFSGGGEPTYDWKKFIEIVLMITCLCQNNKVDYSLGLTSNGSLTNEQLGFIAEHFDNVMISYDGIPSIQRKNRYSPHMVDTNDCVVNSIKFLSSKNILVTVRTTIWQDNIHWLRPMADYIFTQIDDRIIWSIRPAISAGRAIRYINSNKIGVAKENFFISYLDIVRYVNVHYPLATVSTPLFPNAINDFPCGEISLFCDSPCLMPDGRIITCMESYKVSTEIGFVKQGKTVYYDKFKDPLLDNCQKQMIKCKPCLAYNFCKGGCPIRNIISELTDTSIRDWECDMIKEYFKYILISIANCKSVFGWYSEPVFINDKLVEHIYKIQHKD